MAKSWYDIKAAAKGRGEIAIYDEIGLWGIQAGDFARDLKAMGDVTAIDLRINSPGGEVFAGIAIYNMLRRHKAKVTVTVDGIAASAASLIAMAGDEIVMPENALMMIHDPSGVVIGGADDMRDIADALDKTKMAMVSAYRAKTGLTDERIAAIMAEETWLSAAEAVELGFADRIEKPVKMAANFHLLHHFRNAPERLMQRPDRTPPAPEPEPPTAAGTIHPGGDPAEEIASIVADANRLWPSLGFSTAAFTAAGWTPSQVLKAVWEAGYALKFGGALPYYPKGTADGAGASSWGRTIANLNASQPADFWAQFRNRDDGEQVH